MSIACIRRKSVQCYRHCQGIFLKSNDLSIDVQIELSGRGKVSNELSNLTKNHKQMNRCGKVVFEVMISSVMEQGAMDTSRDWWQTNFRWNAVYGESRTYGVDWGKNLIQKLFVRDLPISIANNAFKRAAYGLIDYYLEEERALREKAERTNMDEKVLETKLDMMWGKVTLYNTYQLFVQLTSQKSPNPMSAFVKEVKSLQGTKKKGKYYDDNWDEPTYQEKMEEFQLMSKVLYEDKPEVDLLALYFNASNALPMNSMRRLVSNADNALRAMGGADKMMAS